MFYSLLTLNPRSHQVQAEIAAPYEMHKTLLKAFSVGKFERRACRSRGCQCAFPVGQS